VRSSRSTNHALLMSVSQRYDNRRVLRKPLRTAHDNQLGESRMSNTQVESLEEFLTWLKTCPNHYTISSMQGGFVHVKFLISVDRKKEDR
jgi:hypothetical protein